MRIRKRPRALLYGGPAKESKADRDAESLTFRACGAGYCDFDAVTARSRQALEAVINVFFHYRNLPEGFEFLDDCFDFLFAKSRRK